MDLRCRHRQLRQFSGWVPPLRQWWSKTTTARAQVGRTAIFGAILRAIQRIGAQERSSGTFLNSLDLASTHWISAFYAYFQMVSQLLSEVN
jgi:hypothetical protein